VARQGQSQVDAITFFIVFNFIVYDRYAITPRFAPTSTDRQLELAGQLAREHPTVHVHTHLCENTEEVNLVKHLFGGRDYLGVYQDHGLVTCKSIFAHCVHVSQEHLQALAQAGSSIAFCPSSNSFLGSGLFPLERALAAGVKVGLATDVGAGTSLSMLKTMGDAYKVIQLRQQQDKQQHHAHAQEHSLSPLHLFHLATMGSAYALGIHNEVMRLFAYFCGCYAAFAI
jgi:guanine deaminase